MKSRIKSGSNSLVKSFLLAFLVIVIVFVSLLAIMNAGNQDIRGRAASGVYACASPNTCVSGGMTACINAKGTPQTSYACSGSSICCLPATPTSYTCLNTPGQFCSPHCPGDNYSGVGLCAPGTGSCCGSSITATPILSISPTPTGQKILLLGDSMIASTDVPTSIDNLLKWGGYQVQFVGDTISVFNNIPIDGFGGFSTGMILQQLTSTPVWTELNGTPYPNNFVNNIPDIVIIQLGTNDANNSTNPLPGYEANIEQIIGFLHSENSHMNIIVAKLIPSKVKTVDERIQLINAAIPSFVQQMNSKYPHVGSTQDLRSVWKSEDFVDNFHPSMTGSEKIGQSYYDALLANGFVSK